MATIENLQFEQERRVVLFKSTTTLPDGTALGWNEDPNNVVASNSAGEALLYGSPLGTTYITQLGVTYQKTAMPNTWTGTSGTGLVRAQDVKSSSFWSKYDYGHVNGHWTADKSVEELGNQVLSNRYYLDYVEMKFDKNTAFNKNFGTTSGTIPQGNHNHSGVYSPYSHSHAYEPAFGKYSAFNKNFGTSAGTVAYGNHHHNGVYAYYSHNHSGVYEPAFGKNTGFNLPIGDLHDSVARGSHGHLYAWEQIQYHGWASSPTSTLFNLNFNALYEYMVVWDVSQDGYNSFFPYLYFNQSTSGTGVTSISTRLISESPVTAVHIASKGTYTVNFGVGVPYQTVVYDSTFSARMFFHATYEAGNMYNWDFDIDCIAHPTDQSNVHVGVSSVKGTFDGAINHLSFVSGYTGSNNKRRISIYRRAIY